MGSSSPPSAPTAPSPTPPPPSNYLYPPAPSPDIIRSHQKDTHLTLSLHTHLTSLIRSLYGTRFTHTHDTDLRALTEVLYFGLTTLLGNRTLGEEYCDIYQVESRGSGQRLPAVGRRAEYILSAVVVPYALGKILPGLRARIRLRIERNLARTTKDERRTSLRYKLQGYLLENLSTITSISTSPISALSLAVFYFNGSYYHLSKRLFGLRYIFSRHLAPSEQRVGYEVLGVLLVLQMVVQAYLHIHNTISTILPTESSSAMLDDGVEVGLSSHQHPQQVAADLETPMKADTSRLRISQTTHTPLPPSANPRYDLSEASTLAWLQPQQQRKCTLCLEPMKDPSVTTCGHVFCWTCILDWVEEKPECPLCRQEVMGQHVLPLRG